LTGSKPMNYIYTDGRLKKEERNLLSSSSGNGIGPFLSAVKRPSHGGGRGVASSFFLILY
jgi:hypothetical protein